MPSNKEQFSLNIFDNSPVAYCVLELVLNDEGQPIDWIYRYCNQAFADIKGYRLEKMIDRSFLSLHPDSDNKWLEACYRAAYENIPGEIDVSYMQNYHVTISPIGRKGFCSGMICKPQNSARTDQEEYNIRQLFPEYVSLYKIDLISHRYEILRIDDTTNAKNIADNDPRPFMNFDDFCRQYAAAFITEEDREEFLDWHSCENIKKRLSLANKSSYHYRSVSKDGKSTYYEVYAVKGTVTDTSFTVFLGYRNVDSILYKEKAIQKKLKEALDENNLHNEIISAIAKTYQYISRIDIDANWYEVISNRNINNVASKRSGIASVDNELMVQKVIADEYKDSFLKFADISTLPERMKNEETIVTEYQIKDGSWHKLRFIEQKRDENGRLTHVICAIRSISNIKRKEFALLHQIAEVKKENALKTTFLSNMSHDIRTPMNGIIGMIDLANRYPTDLEIQQKCRDKIMESSKFLVSLVNDILDMSKLESGELINHDLSFDLTELLNRVNTSKQSMADEKNVEYVVDWEKADIKHIHLVGNPIYLERMLTAVSDNAIKFTQPGGCVRVWCIEKSVDSDHVTYEFGCSDNGIGMSESFLEHAFDVFSQENTSSRTKYEGAGLGLAISKKLAERLGGTIEIQSKKGVGTTVIMTIPFGIGKADTYPSYMDCEKVSVKGLHALLAEDNELNREIAEFMLESMGICVECACDGVDAVNKFESSEQGYYDIILMDIMMPNMNGWDAARMIRSMKRSDSAGIPIIAMSANSFADDIINSRISGMNEHLSKPLDDKSLLGAIKKCIAERDSVLY